MSRRLQAIFIISLCISSVAQAKKKIYYKLSHDSCRMRVVNNLKSDEDLEYKELIFKLFKERNYKAAMLKENKKLIAGDFHSTFTWQRTGEKLFKNCDFNLLIITPFLC